MHIFPERTSLDGLGSELFKLVSYGASREQWAEWLRVPLEHAASRGNLSLVERLLRAGADAGAGWRGCRGRTLLDAAALGGNADVMPALIRGGAGADVNKVTVSSRRSALYTATCCGHEAVAKRLILAGADVNFRDPVAKCNVLSQAIQGNHTQLVNDLLIGGARPNIRDECGMAPLQAAALFAQEGVVSTLLLAKVDVNVGLRKTMYETPLMIAVRRGHLAIVETLLEAGADCILRQLADYSPLDVAAEQGTLPILEAILGRGVDVDAQDRAGCTALHTAVLFSDRAGPAVHMLVKAGADTELKSVGGWTPLHAAAVHHRVNCVAALLQNNASVRNRFDATGDTPLHRACADQREGLAASIDLLLRWGADETTRNKRGRTPLDVLGATRTDNPHCSPDEVDRARLLLVRAPADRRWRRRGWLVVLRSRTVVVAHRFAKGASDSGLSLCQARSNGKGARIDVAGSSSGVVELLTELEPEAVFRSILGFL
ncbi:unnamed protein product [Ectocarpus sp. 12 AP-2014]